MNRVCAGMRFPMEASRRDRLMAFTVWGVGTQALVGRLGRMIVRVRDDWGYFTTVYRGPPIRLKRSNASRVIASAIVATSAKQPRSHRVQKLACASAQAIGGAGRIATSGRAELCWADLSLVGSERDFKGGVCLVSRGSAPIKTPSGVGCATFAGRWRTFTMWGGRRASLAWTC